MQHNQRYDEGRLELENVEYVPARHLEGAEETRPGEGWSVWQQGGKHDDTNWARQNDRYRRCEMPV